MSQKIKCILRLCMALFVLLSSVGVKAHTMYCHNTASVSLFLPPKACCDVPSKAYEKGSEVSAPACCLVLSEDVVFEYKNTVPATQFVDFSFDSFVLKSNYIGAQEHFSLFVELEDQNLPPPIFLYIHRSFSQVYII